MRISYYIYYGLVTIVETLMRMFPFPAKTGYQRVGKPDENSPVLLTCNFHLTILRLKKATKGLSYHLLVANSKGINVWCAATGDSLNNHSVISVIKTSGIEDKVNHKKIILPQLAAPGVESKVILKSVGWKILWGPVDAKDIPEFFESNFEKTDDMKQVEFRIIQRIEMAIMWIFLAAMVIMPIWGPLYKLEAAFLLGQICLIYFLALISFPIFEKIFQKEVEKKKAFFSLGNLVVFLINLIYAAIGVVLYVIIYQKDYSRILLRWCIVSFLLVLLVNMELKGSSPTYKSDSHADKLYDIEIDLEKCKGTGICVDVCPRNCYVLDTEKKKITMPRKKYCVQCGACIVQCPFDALYFMNRKGDIIKPETVRKFKLNLMGKRN
ncbi:MAG: 4Fe-4S binding protein [Candidatus Heimdallarchaeota archaeon]|nr:4Fe-4S binding protein [Candidatus Heimdallarchaeota archaeon]MCK4771032.1 4Fe-4S binding protein [Candidatus Heimdallarchaeota archaeon]